MSALIYLTNGPVKIVQAPSSQLINTAVDVSAYRHVSLLLEAIRLVGTSPQYEIVILTGMQLESEDGWVELGTWTLKSAEGDFKLDLTDPLRYIRWQVKQLTGAGAEVTFLIGGVARSG